MSKFAPTSSISIDVSVLGRKAINFHNQNSCFRFSKMILSSYSPITPVDVEAMDRLVENMLETLQAFSLAQIPSASHPQESLFAYAQDLIDHQRRRGPGRTLRGSWCATQSTEGMPGDARIAFIYRPTYIAFSTLCLALMRAPQAFAVLDQGFKALENAAAFCADHGFRGFGYDHWKGKCDALRILALGHVPYWVEATLPTGFASHWVKRLRVRLDEDEMGLRQWLDEGDVCDAWGNDLSGDVRIALQSLQLGRQAPRAMQPFHGVLDAHIQQRIQRERDAAQSFDPERQREARDALCEAIDRLRRSGKR